MRTNSKARTHKRGMRLEDCPDCGHDHAQEPAASAPDEIEMESGGGAMPRIITIMTDVDDRSTDMLARQLFLLNGESEDPIVIVFFTCGGDERAAWAMHDLIVGSPAPVVTVAIGGVASAGTIAYMAGSRRLMAPNARLMIHQPRMIIQNQMLEHDLETTYKDLRQSRHRIERFYARRTGHSLTQIRSWCKTDTYFSAREAVKHGFADALMPIRRFSKADAKQAITTGKKAAKPAGAKPRKKR